MRSDQVFSFYNYALTIEVESLRAENEALKDEVSDLKAQLDKYLSEDKG